LKMNQSPLIVHTLMKVFRRLMRSEPKEQSCFLQLKVWKLLDLTFRYSNRRKSRKKRRQHVARRGAARRGAAPQAGSVNSGPPDNCENQRGLRSWKAIRKLL
jgi:hypothetical protein